MIEIKQIKINPQLPKWPWWQYLIFLIAIVLLLKGEYNLLFDWLPFFK